MTKTTLFLSILLVTTLAAFAADPAVEAHRNLRREAAHRQRRLIFNNDGDDHMVPKNLPATAESLLGLRTTPLVGSQVDSIFYCSIPGPTSLHRTEVGEVASVNLGDGYFPKDSPEGKYYAQVRTIVPELLAQGTDPLQVMVGFCRSHNLEIFCSVRMNDIHDSAHRPDKPLPGFARFKQEHPEYLVGSHEKQPPHGMWSAYDYGHAEVRDLMFRRIEEVCRNYDVDGIELDFFRHGVLFKSVAWGGRATAEELDTMTDLIRRIHRMTMDEGMRRGKPILVAVRIPDSVEYCRGMGIDIERWLREGYVDLMTTTCYFQLNPWEYSVELGHRYGVPVYAGLSESRVKEKVDGKDGGFTRHVTNQSYGARATIGTGNIENYRARAMEAWQAGVDGIYLFNLFDPQRAEWKELGDPKTLAGLDKIHFVSVRRGPPEKGYVGWLAGGPALQNRTILTPEDPRKIGRGTPATFDLRVGDDLGDAAWGGTPPAVTLQLRTKGLRAAPDAEVRLNGHRLEDGTLTEDHLVYAVSRDHVRRGANRVEVRIPAESLSSVEWTLYDMALRIRKESP
jgi:hypothetical protein